MRKLILIVFILCVFMFKCEQIVYIKPTPENLIGVYYLTENSKNFFSMRKELKVNTESTISLLNEKIIQIKNFPYCDFESKCSERLLNGQGTWEIDDDSFLGYDISVNIYSGDREIQGRRIYWIHIYRGKISTFSLNITIGDPDSDESIRYEKSQ